MNGYIRCDSGPSFTNAIDRMRRREVVLQSRAIYRGQSNPSWRLQSLWERRFLHPQQAGLWEPYYIQPHDGVKIRIQREFLEMFRQQVQLALPHEVSRIEEQLWALGRHYGLITPLLDWTLDPYKALYFALRHRTGSEPAAAAVWVLLVSETTSPYDGIWDDEVFPRIDWKSVSSRQHAQEGVFTRLSHPIFADLEQFLRNKLGDRSASACLVKIEILPSAIPDLLGEFAQRGINEASLGFASESDKKPIDYIVARCNAALMAVNPSAPPTLPKIDQAAVGATAKRLAEQWLATIGPGKAQLTGRKAFPFLRSPAPRYIW